MSMQSQDIIKRSATNSLTPAPRVRDSEVEVAKLIDVIDDLGGVLIYTADHGNADIMFTESDGVRSPKTSHTLSPVPFAIHDPNYDGDYHMANAAPGPTHGLANVAATVFNLLGYEAPDDYLPSLIDF